MAEPICLRLHQLAAAQGTVAASRFCEQRPVARVHMQAWGGCRRATSRTEHLQHSPTTEEYGVAQFVYTQPLVCATNAGKCSRHNACHCMAYSKVSDSLAQSSLHCWESTCTQCTQCCTPSAHCSVCERLKHSACHSACMGPPCYMGDRMA